MVRSLEICIFFILESQKWCYVFSRKAYSTTKDYAERVNYIIDSIREQEKSVGEIKIKRKEDSKVTSVKKINKK